MTVKHIAFIGNSLPRRCGIATFTTDLQQAVSCSVQGLKTTIVAMNDGGRSYDYPSTVEFQIDDDRIEDYIDAAGALNARQFDVVCLQHEYGIFGGEAGAHILALLSRLNMPVVTTLHTVLARPTLAQRDVLRRVVEMSSVVVVMAIKARDLLRDIYQVPIEKIEIIPHGIPDFPLVGPEIAKAKLGFAGKSVVLTFGLLSPNKGIEVMIDAMPAILKSRPDTVYVVLGATHPNLVREQGEAYRRGLIARARERGVKDSVVFLDQFVDLPTLLDFISMCDVYTTPYLNEAQMTSGTLAYSFGLGKPVVSTPYWHACELLADGRGILVPFGDAKAIGQEIADLLTDDARRQAMRVRAYADSRAMVWSRVAERYNAAFSHAQRNYRSSTIATWDRSGQVPAEVVPPRMQIGHFLSMCDDTGLFQHASHAVPNRAHGYCVDDNARALVLACALNQPGERALPEALTTRLAAFVQHAWNPATSRFRNFMNFERMWLEESGSEDSHGRTLWALGECARADSNLSRRQWAGALFCMALPAAEAFRSPRAWAFTLLGLESYCGVDPDNSAALRLRRLLADRLLAILASVETTDWVWFESGLAYDNARLPQALIVTGISTAMPVYLECGLKSLSWLMTQQVGQDGIFRPVGTDSFGDTRKRPRMFDQQPLEATATISACLAASRVGGDPRWRDDAARAFAWFLGDNDLSLPLVDLVTGSCRDGLHPDRVNENCGGESAVSYLISLAEIRQAHRSREVRVKTSRVLPKFTNVKQLPNEKSVSCQQLLS